MGLFLNNYNDIARLNTRVLISFTVEGVLLVIWCTLVDLSIDDLFLLYYFLTIAGFALILFIYNLTFATTIIARTRRLSVHAWSKLLHSCDHTTTFTCAALLNGTILAPFTGAGSTDAFAVYSNLSLFAHIDFLERHLKRVLHRLHFFGSTLL